MKFRPGSLQWAAMVTAVLLVSCGGGDTEGEASFDQSGDNQQATTTVVLGSVCENPPPTQMSPGDAGQLGGSGLRPMLYR
ncbi:MAG: hypothetical protein IH850_00475 [Acidobacteria bacterium]|nr:hypothetical protein [Acidobacteriota bacterium]